MDAKGLRIVFMGTPDFAVMPLKRLVDEGYNIAGVVTTPDKPAGRGLKVRESAVKEYACKAGLKVLQPVKLKDPQFLEEFMALEPDLAIVIAFRMLPEAVWSAPRLGTFNLHASLLPQYRGAAPINWAVMNGETKTGVTTFFLNHEIDKGAILGRREVGITAEDTAGTLHDKLMLAGTDLVVETVVDIASGNIVPVEQPASDADLRPAPKIFKEDCLIRWDNDCRHIYDFIRGLSPYPAAWAYLIKEGNAPVCVARSENERGETESESCPQTPVLPESLQVKIFSAAYEVATHSHVHGKIFSDEKTYIKVACGDGYIYIKELQLAGKKRMTAGDFLRGFKGIPDYTF